VGWALTGGDETIPRGDILSLRANPNENSIQLRKLTNQIVQNS
jgi:hypothetical protein